MPGEPALERLEPRTLLDTTLPLVTMQIIDSEVAEEGPDPGAIRLHRTGVLDEPLFVFFDIQQPNPPTQRGIATNGIDYIGLSNIVRIPAGKRTVTIPIIPIDDLEVEGPEEVRFSIMPSETYRLDETNPLRRSGVIVIREDDALPLVTIRAADASAAEIGGASAGAVDTARFIITRTGDRALPLTVNFRIRGSATHGVDYERIVPQGQPTRITIPAGRKQVAITIRPINDNLFEGDETVRIILQPSTGQTSASMPTTRGCLGVHHAARQAAGLADRDRPVRHAVPAGHREFHAAAHRSHRSAAAGAVHTRGHGHRRAGLPPLAAGTDHPRRTGHASGADPRPGE